MLMYTHLIMKKYNERRFRIDNYRSPINAFYSNPAETEWITLKFDISQGWVDLMDWKQGLIGEDSPPYEYFLNIPRDTQ